MGVAESLYYLFQEFQCCLSITLANRLCFYPLGDFINCHKEVGVLVGGSYERSHHIKSPYRKGPSDRNHPEFLRRYVILLRIALTSITLLDNILSIRVCRKPGEVVSVGFGHKRARAGMMSTITRMYFVEDGSSFFW